MLAIVAFYIGIGIALLGFVAFIWRRKLLSSEVAKMGGGLRSYFTKEGIQHGGGCLGVSEGTYVVGRSAEGVPLFDQTRKIIL